jgi:hypothetical protein
MTDLDELEATALHGLAHAIGPVIRELREARAEIEQLRVQLAGVSVVALGGLRPEVSVTRGDYGWSPAYADVRKLREEAEALRGQVEKLRAAARAPATSEGGGK